MAHQAPNNHRRMVIIPNSVCDKMRKLVPDLAHRDDQDIGNLLDKAISDEGLGNADEWWEDDFAYGIRLNLVIQIDQHVQQMKEPLFAIIRDADDGKNKIVITVLNQYAHDCAIEEGRWRRKPPRRSRYQHPERSSGVGHNPFKVLESIRDSLPEKAPEPEEVEELIEDLDPVQELVEEPERVIIYNENGEQKLMFTGGPMGSLKDAMEELISRAVAPDSISVWARTSIRPRITVELEGL